MTQILILSQKVCLISRKRGPTPVCRPGICSLGVFKPLNIQTMHFTKVQISELIRKHVDLKYSINFASALPQADLLQTHAVKHYLKKKGHTKFFAELYMTISYESFFVLPLPRCRLYSLSL